MPEENMNKEFRLKKIDGVKKYLIEKINRNELMSKKHEKDCKILSYIDHSFILINQLISTVTECVSISAFASLVGVPIGIISSAIGLKICAITAGIEKYKLVNKKRKRIMIKWYHYQNLN